ncbi:MAG TPA: polymer-forming cytoskeletal protein [Nitrospira sp.]|nr:polymer-forming cytoskeletal protein [Nitrospira sp.]
MWGQDKQESKRTTDGADENGQTEDGSSTAAGAEDISAFVGKGVEFKGTISYSGTVRIDGALDGEIRTDGTLLIGEEAVIQAKISAGTIVCKGKITGDVVAKERVKLRAPAVVNGSVKTPVLSMEDGVLFNGGLEMNQSVRESAQGAAVHSLGGNSQPAAKRVNG